MKKVDFQLIASYARNELDELAIAQVNERIKTDPEFCQVLAVYLNDELLFEEVIGTAALLRSTQ